METLDQQKQKIREELDKFLDWLLSFVHTHCPTKRQVVLTYLPVTMEGPERLPMIEICSSTYSGLQRTWLVFTPKDLECTDSDTSTSLGDSKSEPNPSKP